MIYIFSCRLSRLVRYAGQWEEVFVSAEGGNQIPFYRPLLLVNNDYHHHDKHTIYDLKHKT